jgi:flagellar hook-length control protein FliK
VAQMPAVSGTQVAQSESAETEEALPVVQQLAQPLVTASEQLTPGEHKTLKLKLRPEELGQVDIEITRDAAGRLNAHFTVEHDQTQRVLREELGQLRTALEQAGWQVEQLAISTQQPHLGGQTGGQSAQQGATDSMPFSLPEREPLNDTEPTSNGGLPTAQDRLLNLHA